MNNRAKRLIKHLEAIGCHEDYDHPSRKARVFRHPNAPEQELKVFPSMTDSTATRVRKIAEKIAEFGESGKVDVPTVKERARITRQSAKAKRDQERRERNERAARAEADHQRREREKADEKRRREIEELMQHGRGY